jgi:hypothetical protein
MSMETGATKTGATNTKESQAPRERDKMGQVQIVVVDLRKTQPTDQVNALRKGEGSLFMNVERIIEQLVTAGTIRSNAQPVVVVVRENSAPAIEVSDDTDDD